MITVGDNSYKLLQLDTNALSNILKEENSKLTILMNSFPFNKYVICYSPFTLLEISRSKYLLERFCQIFSIVPSFILKGYEHLRDEEIDNYYINQKIIGVLFSPFDIRTETGKFISPNDLKSLLKHEKLVAAFDKWEKDKYRILNGILSLKENFKPKGLKYTKKEIEYFVKFASFQQIRMHNSDFINQNKLSIENIFIDKFPSFKIMSYSVFYKFYADNRNPQLSDLFDILTGVTAPYVDALITEKQYFDSLIKTKKLDSFIDNLEIIKINEL